MRGTGMSTATIAMTEVSVETEVTIAVMSAVDVKTNERNI
jgi:hypothetical protein